MTSTTIKYFEHDFSLFKENGSLWSVEAFIKRMDERIAKIRSLKENTETSPLVNSTQKTHE